MSPNQAKSVIDHLDALGLVRRQPAGRSLMVSLNSDSPVVEALRIVADLRVVRRPLALPGMKTEVLLGFVGLLGVVFSTLYATGGAAALARRSMKQELDLARDLPEGSTARKELEDHLETRVRIYVWRAENIQRPREPLRTLGISLSGGLGLVAVIVAAALNGARGVGLLLLVIALVIAYGLLLAIYGAMLRWLVTWFRGGHHERMVKGLPNDRSAPPPSAVGGQ